MSFTLADQRNYEITATKLVNGKWKVAVSWPYDKDQDDPFLTIAYDYRIVNLFTDCPEFIVHKKLDKALNILLGHLSNYILNQTYSDIQKAFDETTKVTV